MVKTYGPQDAPQLLREFLMCAIHHLLYLRNVYPSELFEQARMYDAIAVRVCRHGDVLQYIGGLLDRLGVYLDRGVLERVVLVITTENGTPLERFIFDIGCLWATQLHPRRVPVEHLEASLRAFMARIASMDTFLPPPMSKDTTFAVLAHIKDDPKMTVQAAQEESRHWEEIPRSSSGSIDPLVSGPTSDPMPVDPPQALNSRDQPVQPINNAGITPVKHLVTDLFSLQLAVETAM